MAPDFARFEQDYGSKITIITVNVDDKAAMMKYLKLMESGAIPQTIVLRNNKEVSSRIGAMTYEELQVAAAAAL